MPLSSPTPCELVLRDQLARTHSRSMPWAEVMARALYDPEHGYYGRGPLRIGRGGDFYTAVSVGPLYGQLLASAILEAWQSLDKPTPFTLIEQGAHDGQLLHDIATALIGTELDAVMDCCIVEPRDDFRTAQRARLQPLLGERLRWVDAWPDAHATNGIVVCNELLDAFPVQRVQWNGEAWMEGAVHCPGDDSLLKWQWTHAAKGTAALPSDLPFGYTTEIHPAASAWMAEVVAQPWLRAMIIADYGYEADEYYVPERSNGTLRRYVQHRSDTDVLLDLGECDLTAHINFTPLIDIAAEQGFAVRRFMDQGRFLTHAAAAWLRSLEGRAPDASTRALLRQFQTLTHPQHMGTAFRVLQLERRP